MIKLKKFSEEKNFKFTYYLNPSNPYTKKTKTIKAANKSEAEKKFKDEVNWDSEAKDIPWASYKAEEVSDQKFVGKNGEKKFKFTYYLSPSNPYTKKTKTINATNKSEAEKIFKDELNWDSEASDIPWASYDIKEV